MTVWDVEKRAKKFEIPMLVSDCHSLEWAPDGKSFCFCSRPYDDKVRGVLKVCNSENGKISFEVDKDDIGLAAWSQNGNWFAYSDKDVHILRAATMQEVMRLSPEGHDESAAFSWSPKRNLIAYRGTGPTLQIFDVNAMQALSTFQADRSGLFQFQWSPDGAFLTLTNNQDQVAVCDLNHGIRGAKSFDHDATFSWTPDSKSLVESDNRTRSVNFIPLNLEPGRMPFPDGVAGDPWRQQHVVRNLDDCFEELTNIFGPVGLKRFKETKEKDLCLYEGGPGLGMELRNTWGLRAHTPIVKYFNNLGITNGADMSTIIIESFWRHQNDLPLNLEKQITECKKLQEAFKAIISVNERLPQELATFVGIQPDGGEISIGKCAGKVTIISFVCTKYGPSLDLLNSLSEVRKKYSAESLSAAYRPWRLGSPQTLLIKDNTIITRFNNWNFGDQGTKSLEDAIDAGYPKSEIDIPFTNP